MKNILQLSSKKQEVRSICSLSEAKTNSTTKPTLRLHFDRLSVPRSVSVMAIMLHCVFLIFNSPQAQAQIISTFAGTGTSAYTGDGGQASAAELNSPQGITIDNQGNIYFIDYNNSRVRKISTAGIISTVVGNGTAGYSGDGGQATAAELNQASYLTTDNMANIYISDWYNSRIRKVNTAGIISTIAGTGTGWTSGNGGPATAAEINQTRGITLDNSGNIYFVDGPMAGGQSTIRKINTAGIINAFAGGGIGGFYFPSTLQPQGLCTDIYGNVYVADEDSNCIRKVNTAGVVTKVVGKGTYGYTGDGGQATAAELEYPSGISVDGLGNMYISDGSDRIRKVTTSGIITTIAGNGSHSYSGDGVAAISVGLSPFGVTHDAIGNMYITDAGNNRIRKVCMATNMVSGTIYTPSSTPVTAGVVYAFKQRGLHNGHLDTLGHTSINSNGTYTFTTVLGDNYILAAVADSTTYPTAIKTYYSTTPGSHDYLWGNATVFHNDPCMNGSLSGKDITIIEIPAQSGNGIIKGNVGTGAGYGTRLANGGNNNVMGVPLKGVDVKLGKNPGGGCANRTTSDGAGNYTFTNVDTGSYSIYVDVPNFGMVTILTTTITPTNTISINNNYCIDSANVNTCSTAGIRIFSSLYQSFSIYPNPSNSVINVELGVMSETTKVEVLNTLGEVVIHNSDVTLSLSKGITHNLALDVSGFPAGVYFIRVGTATQKFIKQ